MVKTDPSPSKNSTATEKQAEEALSKLRRKEEEEATNQKAVDLGLPYLDLRNFPLNPEAVAILDEKEAREAKMVVLEKTGKTLRVGTIDPQNSKTKEVLGRLREKEGYQYKLFLISLSSLKKAWRLYRRVPKKRPTVEEGKLAIEKGELTEFEKGIKTIVDLKKRINQLPVTEILETIMAGAIKADASDIHLEPEEKEMRLRYRLDGVLQDIASFSKESYSPLLSRVKMLAKLKLNVHDKPQDGRFTITIGRQEIDVRVSILPSAYGETVVMRLLTFQGVALDLEKLGLRTSTYDIIKKELKKPNGMILTTGPTGSGKTTTLYSFLKRVNKPEIKIITLEDPIEYHLEGISQTQVEVEKGYTFAKGLRSALRQDPDVILVGEIRDLETAEIACNAALTGHLVFSTLHTNNAAGTIPRLIDLGVKPFVLAPAINLAMAQRLVRKVCQYCQEEYEPDKKTLDKIKKILEQIPQSFPEHPTLKPGLKLKRGKGCSKCNQTGYKGRIGIFELFPIDNEIEKLILSSPPASQIQETAIKKGMLTMTQDGVLKVLEGITTMEEIARVTEE